MTQTLPKEFLRASLTLSIKTRCFAACIWAKKPQDERHSEREQAGTDVKNKLNLVSHGPVFC